jgi:hypothetical protein
MTKNELIAQFKIDHPTLQSGSDETGYTQLGQTEYEATIEQWADNVIAQQESETQKQAAREAVEAKLEALGLTPDDLKALGL